MYIELNFVTSEVGHVVAVEIAVIIVPGIALRKEEGLRGATFIVDAGEVEQAVEPVFATRGEDDPARIAAPVVERFGTVGIGFGERMTFAVCQVEEPEVGLLVVDGEVAEVGLVVEQPSTVVTGSG